MKELKDWLYLFDDDAVLTVVATMGRLFAKDDGHTYRHSLAVAHYAGLCAEAMQLPSRVIEEAVIVGLLHDIGKTTIERHVLAKGSDLTPAETTELRDHTRAGEDILRALPRFMAISRAVRAHHERWDGQGFPDQLSGTQIPIAARLVTVADAFDVMTGGPPDRPGMSVDAALAELAANRGQMYDPDITTCFIELVQTSGSPLPSQPATARKALRQADVAVYH
ncbi:MAG: HD domain-containing protein [Candidatus Sericytochromatia bacterium]|nr:HD domain-containing protein [Candidatus Sericytochromatia bacterium]